MKDPTDHVFRLPVQPEYDHVQHAPLYWLMLGPSFVLLFVAMTMTDKTEDAWPVLGVAALIGLTAYSMHHLRVYDDGESLVARFGPIPIFHKRIWYNQIESFAADRSTLIDGWGVHWVLGRGWTFNLWGFDCVRFELAGGRTVRIGTNDPTELVQFLAAKRAASPPEARE